MKKTLLFILALALLFPLAPTRAAEEPEVFVSGDYRYVLREDGTAEIQKYTGSDLELAVPDALDGHAVTCIGDRAFMDQRDVREITLPDGVVAIRDKAFSNCLNLDRIVLPDSVAQVGANPFAGARALIEIVVSPDHPYLAVADGVLFSKAEERLICCPTALAKTAYAVPEGTRAIGDLAFYGCRDLISVTLPEGVTSIGDGAFYSCLSLTGITLPNSVAEVGANPFRYSSALTEIDVAPDHPYLTAADGVLFSKADERLICCLPVPGRTGYAVPEGTKVIGGYAFAQCVELVSITLPDSVTVLEHGAFYFCEQLTGIVLPEGVEAIPEDGFCGCGSLVSVNIPQGVTSIGAYAFFRCAALPDLVLPAGVASIGVNAFARCDSLTLTVSPDSFAARYCKDNDLPCTYAGN